MKGAYRSIGINRNDFLSVIQMRSGMEKSHNILEWVAFASNAFNVLVPFYADIERYQEKVMAKGHELICKYDRLLAKETDTKRQMELKKEGNQQIADMLKRETADTLDKVLFELSSQMRNSYSRSDA